MISSQSIPASESRPIPATSEADAVPGGDFEGTLILISHDRAFIVLHSQSAG